MSAIFRTRPKICGREKRDVSTRCSDLAITEKLAREFSNIQDYSNICKPRMREKFSEAKIDLNTRNISRARRVIDW